MGGEWTCLDLFCGLGGWSDGFAAEGFDCTGVDLAEVGYPYRFIKADVCALLAIDLPYYDVVIGSPPCRDFSRLGAAGRVKWKRPAQPEVGLVLVRAFLEVVAAIQPRYWLLENVNSLQNHIDERILWRGPIGPHRYRTFWGRMPFCLVQRDMTLTPTDRQSGALRSWKRAKIPFSVSLSVARATRIALENGR